MINPKLGFTYENNVENDSDEQYENRADDKEYQYEDKIKKRNMVSKKVKDVDDRATTEQCLDARTRVILMKLINNKQLKEINGCISTGKEANVYHASDLDGKEYAIKIYKTSILVFKDRDKYVQGEFRFRNGHCKSNPRKMIKLWAEKEIRNLKRISQSQIPCPEPTFVKSNVLMMQFIGKDMTPAPRLKDAQDVEYSNVYFQVLHIMRTLHQECKLIHADLSEYNLLYYENKIYMIDVSQSIESDHPQAYLFLKRDIQNINNYFKKQGVHVFTLRQIFKFITDEHLKNEETEIDNMIKERMDISEEQEEIEDSIFLKAIQPKDLNELPTKVLLQEMDKNTNEKVRTLHQIQNLAIKVLNNENDVPQSEKNQTDSKQSASDSSESEEEDNSSSDISLIDDEQTIVTDVQESVQTKEKKQGGLHPYEGLSKIERKKKVKEENKEKRKNKLPKSMKKFLTKKKH
ncbi:hypothetical protein pb186bvf_005814 [Paramecium bursaria]